MSPVSRLGAVALVCSIVFTVFVATVVNYLIYTSRWSFALLRPDYVARNPPTISRAISEPAVGEPFANWMLISAPLLFIAVAVLMTVLVRSARRQAGAMPRGQLGWIVGLAGVVILLQALASVGMVMLSQFRFPTHNALHMAGSYLFFFSQAFAVFIGEMLSRSCDAPPLRGQLLGVATCRFRRWLILVPAALGMAYLALFIVKDLDTGPAAPLLYQTYVSVELLLISSFLFYFLAWIPESVLALRRYLRA